MEKRIVRDNDKADKISDKEVNTIALPWSKSITTE